LVNVVICIEGQLKILGAFLWMKCTSLEEIWNFITTLFDHKIK